MLGAFSVFISFSRINIIRLSDISAKKRKQLLLAMAMPVRKSYRLYTRNS